MRILVCRPKGPLSTLRVYTDSEAVVAGEFEAWTVLTGRQVLFVERDLNRLLQHLHVGGAYEQGALYALEYVELCAVLRERLGPSDRERYMQLLQNTRSLRPVWLRTPTIAYTSWRLAGVLGFIVYKAISTIVFFGVIAALLSLFKKHR